MMKNRSRLSLKNPPGYQGVPLKSLPCHKYLWVACVELMKAWDRAGISLGVRDQGARNQVLGMGNGDHSGGQQIPGWM